MLPALPMIASFSHGTALVQQPVHAAPGAMVLTLAKQGRVNFSWRLVDETLGVQHVDDAGSRRVRNTPRVGSPSASGCRRRGLRPSVSGGSAQADCGTG